MRNESIKNLSERDKFILRLAAVYTPKHIFEKGELKDQGFKPVSRERIYHILKANGVKPLRHNRVSELIK